MPRTLKPISATTEAINRRFFLAIERLIADGRIDSLSGFCLLHDLSASRYRAMRLQYGVTPKADFISQYKNLELEAIHALTANYPISAQWLITGRGSMLL